VKRVFVDTGAWVAIEDSRDDNHDKALQYKIEISGSYILITSDFVLDETYTLLLLNVGHGRTLTFRGAIQTLARAGILQVADISPSLNDAAWNIFERFNTDKQWSFTDCTSYALMKQFGIDEVFAFDHHFEQMGFIRKP